MRDDLSSMFSALTVAPVEAGFEVSDGEVSVTEGRDGQKVDEEKLLDEVETGLLEGEREYEVPVATTNPKLTTEEAQSLKPTALLGSYRTNYMLTTDKSPERVENLRIASDAISNPSCPLS